MFFKNINFSNVAKIRIRASKRIQILQARLYLLNWIKKSLVNIQISWNIFKLKAIFVKAIDLLTSIYVTWRKKKELFYGLIFWFAYLLSLFNLNFLTLWVRTLYKILWVCLFYKSSKPTYQTNYCYLNSTSVFQLYDWGRSASVSEIWFVWLDFS